MEPNTTDPIVLEDERDKALAEQLRDLLTERGVPCTLHWDRSPWGVRIWLTPRDGREYMTPSIYALVEGGKWNMSLGGFGEDLDDTFTAWSLSWYDWGRDLNAMADDLIPLIKILRRGVMELIWNTAEVEWRWDD